MARLLLRQQRPCVAKGLFKRSISQLWWLTLLPKQMAHLLQFFRGCFSKNIPVALQFLSKGLILQLQILNKPLTLINAHHRLVLDIHSLMRIVQRVQRFLRELRSW